MSRIMYNIYKIIFPYKITSGKIIGPPKSLKNKTFYFLFSSSQQNKWACQNLKLQ